MSAGLWVIHIGPKSGGELVTFFLTVIFIMVSMHAVVVVAQLMLRVIGFLGWKSQENRSKAPEVHYPEFF